MLKIQVEMTSIQMYTATTNLEMASDLANRIKVDFKGSELIFQPVHIITPNKAQHQWLKEKLAENLGFIANLKQHSLRSFFKELIGALDPSSKEKPGKEKLIWKLFSEMGNPEFKGKFPKIKTYCGEDEIKRLALAQKLAGLFEDYLEYDPEGTWKDQSGGGNSKEDLEWQLRLFKECGFENLQTSPKDFRSLLKKNLGVLSQFHSLYLFGNLEISPLHLEYLKALAKADNFSIQIYRTHLNFEQKKNPLAQNWGDYLAQTKAQVSQLGKLPEKLESLEGKTLLEKIQKNILTDDPSKDLPEDDSIIIYNSFTRVREVEALYNYLVKTVDESGGELGARDIMVCMPTLDPYISAIRTVFDSAPYKFPYTLVSRGYGREESFWTALEQVLSFSQEDFTAPGVFNLLEMEPIQNAFGFTDLDLLKKAFIDANIRREYKGDETLETNYASFSNGLNRLIYGFCMGSVEPVEIAGKMIYPVDIAEGQQAQDLFRLHHLVELLNDFLTIKSKKRSVGDWHSILMKKADEFLHPEDWQQNQLSDLMEELGSMEASGGEEIGFNTFFFRLKDQLQNKDLQQIKGHGGITFSGLYPEMSMPKKVVAFLGLNFKEFPRRSQELSFDLLPEMKKPESRVIDRGAFLETFLNAKQKVLLSYIGQNVKDNSEIPSSSLISELQDYAEKSGANIKEVKHPLHAFNSRYFEDEEEDLFTYYQENSKKVSLKCGIENNQKLPTEISLSNLESFLKDPFQHHYNRVLNIRYKEKEDLPDWEIFSLNNLESWTVKDFTLKNKFKSTPSEFGQLRKEIVQMGLLPLRTIGEMNLQEADERVNLLWLKFQEISNNSEFREEEILLKFSLRNKHIVQLNGKVQMMGGSGLLLNVSKRGKKYEILAFVRYLALLASGKAQDLNYIHLNDEQSEAQVVSINNGWTRDEAYDFLKSWLQDLIDNYSRIIPFSPNFNFEVNDIATLSLDEEGPEKLKPLIDNKFGRYGNCYPSAYLQREYYNGFFEEESNLVEFMQKYTSYLGPIEEAFK